MTRPRCDTCGRFVSADPRKATSVFRGGQDTHGYRCLTCPTKPGEVDGEVRADLRVLRPSAFVRITGLAE